MTRSQGTIMVVDDDILTRTLLGGILADAGYHVRAAEDGDDALARMCAEPPDLIVLDVVMPGLDGFEVCRRLQADPVLHEVPVVFITGSTDLETVVTAFAVGGVDHVTKPIRREELLARVGTHLALRHARHRLEEHRDDLESQIAARTDELARANRQLEERNVELEASRDRLARSEAALLEAQRLASIGSWRLELSTGLLTWSEECYRILGVPVGQPVATEDFFGLVHPDDLEELRAAWEHGLADGDYSLEHRIRRQGEVRWLHSRAAFERAADGTAVRAVGTARDITELRAYQASLVAERQRLQAALEAADAGTWDLDLRTGEMRFGRRLTNRLGEPDAPLRIDRQQWETLVHPEDRAHTLAALDDHLAGRAEHYAAEYRLPTSAGGWRWIRAHGRVSVRADDGTPTLMVGIDLDITAQREHQAELAFVAFHDPLTRLPNRARFSQTLRARMASCAVSDRELALLSVDLDGFHAINQLHGHQLGDTVIQEVATRLSEVVDDDASLARIGGDEFTLLIEGPRDANRWQEAATAVRELIAAPLPLAGHQHRLTASVGVTTYPRARADDAEQLLRQAEQALYQAKLAGKDRAHLFDVAWDSNERDRFARIERVRQGLQDSEFVLHFQPVVDLRDGEVLAFEALVRWDHPEEGLLLPGKFIPDLDGHPVLIQLGDWVIEAALEQLARWSSDGLETGVSINIDRVQLHDPDFVPRLTRQLERQPTVRATDVQLEILETGALQDLEVAADTVHALHQLGVRVALDDFGTGFSSLTFLKRLAAQTIKIDRSFVRDLLTDPEHAAIVQSVVGLGASLQRTVLAEGIECAQHARLLRQLGVELGQGYAIARPMPAAEVPGWWARWRLPEEWVPQAGSHAEQAARAVAELELSGWRHQLLAHIADPAEPPPAESSSGCGLGRWLQVTDHELDRGAHDRLTALHDDLHHRAARVVARRRPGPLAADDPDLARCEELTHELLAAVSGVPPRSERLLLGSAAIR